MWTLKVKKAKVTEISFERISDCVEVIDSKNVQTKSHIVNGS